MLSVVSSIDVAAKQIEMKASTVGLPGTLHLTRNEWEQTSLIKHHTFHLWQFSDGGRHMLAIVPRADMMPHVPEDAGSGKWREVEVPFSAFKQVFKPQAEWLSAMSADATILD